MSQHTPSYLFMLFFFIGAQHILYAQPDLFRTPTKETFVEANISINSARDFTNVNTVADPFFTDSIAYNISSGDAVELQFKYTQHFAEQFSWYGGVYLGRNPIAESIIVRDDVFTFGSGANFPSTEFIPFRERSIYYGSLIGGLRANTRIFKNDFIYFSLGAKLTIFPKQDLSLNRTRFSQLRSEDIIQTSSSTLDNDTKFSGSVEIDVSYHLVTKSEKHRFLVGVLVDRGSGNIFNVTNDIILPLNTFSFAHVYGGIYFGAYIGFAYVLDSKVL